MILTHPLVDSMAKQIGKNSPTSFNAGVHLMVNASPEALEEEMFCGPVIRRSLIL